MKKSIYPLLTAIAFAFILLFTACHQRELCYDHSHKAKVKVTFDWTNAPEADPETMVVWAFPVDGSEGMRFETVSRGRSRGNSTNIYIELPPGEWQLLCFNGDAEGNVEKGDTFDELVITTVETGLLSPLGRAETAPRPELTEEQPVRSSAGMLWQHTLPSTLTIGVDDGNKGVTHAVTFMPRQVTAVVNVRIEEVENLSFTLEAEGVVTGFAEAWSPGASSPAGEVVTVPFPLEIVGDDALEGSVVVFGDNADPSVRHILRVYTSYKYYYDYDITDAIHEAPDPLNISVTVRGMKLPANAGGMSTGVDNWVDTDDEVIQM